MKQTNPNQGNNKVNRRKQQSKQTDQTHEKQKANKKEANRTFLLEK